MILMACMLVMGMSQCKKENVNSNNQGNIVTITLDVAGDNGSRVIVEPGDDIAPVTYQNGDEIHVISGGVYVGTLKKSKSNNVSKFRGSITNPVEGEPLCFYFFGNVTPQFNADNRGCTVDISDQVVSLPVISMGPSTEAYSSSVSAYSATLLNKCALVKFNVNKPAGYDQAGTCITGMNNLVTVSFDRTTPDTDEGFTYSQINDGAITLSSNVGEVWAILLPQPFLGQGGDMSLFSGCRKGLRPELPEIKVNDYLSDGIDLDFPTEFVPTDALNGLYKVSDNKYVRFARANLKATTTDGWNTWTWGFMDNQYYYETAGDVGQNYAKRSEVSLFGWATSGYNLRGYEESGYCYKPNMTDHSSTNSYAPRINEETDISGAYAKGDWGYNRITNYGYRQWRVLTKAEWDYLLANHTTGWTKIPASNNSNRGYGIMILPYGSTGSIKPSSQGYSLSEWEALEAQGAVFFSVCGYRGGNPTRSITQRDTFCYLWTSTCKDNGGNNYMINVRWTYNAPYMDSQSGRYGCSVRLVCE